MRAVLTSALSVLLALSTAAGQTTERPASQRPAPMSFWCRALSIGCPKKQEPPKEEPPGGERKKIEPQAPGGDRGVNFSVPAGITRRLESVEHPVAWERTVTVYMAADRLRSNGISWDAEVPVVQLPGPVGLKPGTVSLPDLVVCVVDDGVGSSCQLRGRGQLRSPPCPNELQCVIENVPVPRGHFGALVFDLDLRTSDFVSAAIFYEGEMDIQKVDRIQRRLAELIVRLNLSGAPVAFPSIAIDGCTVNGPCQPAGSAGRIGFSEPCGVNVSFSVSVAHHSDNSVVLLIGELRHRCPERIQFLWAFGDGASQVTTSDSVTHQYANSGGYTVTVTALCVGKVASCQSSAVRRTLTVR